MTIPVSHWQAPPQCLALNPGQVDLWRFRLNRTAIEIQRLTDLLARDEKLRAKGLLVEEKRSQFIVARAGLRQILAKYLNRSAEELSFAYGKHGKPGLADFPGLYFNLAHAADLALLAICNTGEVGIDLEKINSGIDILSVAERFFDPMETAALKRIPEHRRLRSFYRIWTQKESLLKLSGSGFSSGLCSKPQVLLQQSRLAFAARDFLACLAVNFSISSINKYQLVDHR